MTGDHTDTVPSEETDRSTEAWDLERYLAELHRLGGGSHHQRVIGQLGIFLTGIRRHRWDVSLPTDAVFFTEDVPRQAKRLPRALAEHVMAQLEDPASLEKWQNPAYRLITLILILMRCGLRLKDATRLPFDCLVQDADGAPHLRYLNHKMLREALVPIDEEVEQDIRDQHRLPSAVARRGSGALPEETEERPRNRAHERRRLSSGPYPWLERCDVRDEHGLEELAQPDPTGRAVTVSWSTERQCWERTTHFGRRRPRPRSGSC